MALIVNLMTLYCRIANGNSAVKTNAFDLRDFCNEIKVLCKKVILIAFGYKTSSLRLIKRGGFMNFLNTFFNVTEIHIYVNLFKRVLSFLYFLIPKRPEEKFKLNPNSFTRDRKLRFRELILFILFMVGMSLKKGKGTLYNVFNFLEYMSKRIKMVVVNASAISRARRKISWEFFKERLEKLVRYVYENELFSEERCNWKGMRVYAIDCSKYRLPGSEELREEFDKESGLSDRSGHYPMCSVNVLYDVFRRIVVRLKINKNWNNERIDAKYLIKVLGEGALVIFDRGYPSYDLINELMKKGIKFIMKISIRSFKAVKDFKYSCKAEEIKRIKKPNKYRNRNDLPSSVVLRLLRMKRIRGHEFIFITNLMDFKKYKMEEIIGLYNRRWEVETHYRNEKVLLEIEKFHSKNVNGVKQEIYASAMVINIARIFMELCNQMEGDKRNGYPQFMNAIVVVSIYVIGVMMRRRGWGQTDIYIIFLMINSRKYYKHKKKRSYPRVNRGDINRWKLKRKEKLEKLNESK